MKSTAQQKEVQLFMERAQRMLNVAEHNLGDDFYESTVNRSYYAVFYAATALLTTEDRSMSRHSGVVSAFRQYFVKTGIFAMEYSDIYGRLLDHRETGDYDLLTFINKEQATDDLQDARTFVNAVQQWLQQEGWL